MSAIGVHHTATISGSWDGPQNKANLKNDGDAAYYRKAYAWQDPDGDPATKAAYKFIHHEVSADGSIGAANTNGCSAGIGIMNGGRTGTTIPMGDYEGVWRHLAAHIRDADLEAPELKRTVDVVTDVRGNELMFVEVRLDVADHKLTGYAAVFNRTSEDLGGWVERIAPGAFADSLLENRDIRALWQHDPSYVLGRTTNGTLSVSEDPTGLLTVITPPDTQWSRDALESIRRGDVNQMSFGFRVAKDGDRWDKRGEVIVRTVLKAQLIEVSPVTFPAYTQTSISTREIRITEAITEALRSTETLSEDTEEGGNSRTLDNLRRRLELADKKLIGGTR